MHILPQYYNEEEGIGREPEEESPMHRDAMPTMKISDEAAGEHAAPAVLHIDFSMKMSLHARNQTEGDNYNKRLDYLLKRMSNLLGWSAG